MTRCNIQALVRRLARDNPEWGTGGSTASWLAWASHRSVDRVGDPQGQQHRPRPAERARWPQFLRSQAEASLACDFFTADLLDGTQAYVLAVIEHATRRVRILGVTLHPSGQ